MLRELQFSIVTIFLILIQNVLTSQSIQHGALNYSIINQMKRLAISVDRTLYFLEMLEKKRKIPSAKVYEQLAKATKGSVAWAVCLENNRYSYEDLEYLIYGILKEKISSNDVQFVKFMIYSLPSSISINLSMAIQLFIFFIQNPLTNNADSLNLILRLNTENNMCL